MNVIISRSDTLSVIFSGKIESVRDVFSLSENLHTLHINAVGWERIADRRIVAEVYRNRTAGYIVADIVAKYFAADGITAGVIEDGDMIPAATFAYRPAADVLRSLSEANDFVWFIDHSKALHFQPRSFSSAPWQIDTIADPAGVNSAGVREVSKYRALEQYRNRQYLKYSEISAERTESFGGDGLTRTWNVELPIAQAPAVAVNGFAQTVGISGIDTGKDFYWNKGSAAITADAGNGIVTDIASRVKVIDRARAIFAEDTFNTIREGLYVGNIIIACGNAAPGDTTSYQFVHTYSVNNGVITPVAIYDMDDLAGTNVGSGVGVGVDHVLFTARSGADKLLLFRNVQGGLQQVTLLSNLPSNYSGELNFGSANGDVIATAYGCMALYVSRVDVDSKEIVPLASLSYAPSRFGNMRARTAWNGNYIAVNTGSAIKVIKWDGASILTEIANFDDNFIASVGIQNCGLSVAWHGNTLYASATNASPNELMFTGIRRYDLDPSTDTLNYVDSYFASTDERGEDLQVIGDIIITRRHIISIQGDKSLRISSRLPTDILDVFERGHVRAPADMMQNRAVVLSGFRDPFSDNSANVYSITIAPPDISVTYRGTYPNVLLSDDPSEQAGRAIIEGGTGIYAAYQNAPDAEGELAAIDIAQTILERYGRVPERFEFTCTREGLQAGQILPVNWPDMGIAEDYLIESVQATDTGGTVVWYRIKAISGRDVGNWQEFWRSLRETDSYDFGGGDTLPVSRSVRDVITEAWSDSAVTDVVEAQTQWDLATFDIDEWQ